MRAAPSGLTRRVRKQFAARTLRSVRENRSKQNTAIVEKLGEAVHRRIPGRPGLSDSSDARQPGR